MRSVTSEGDVLTFDQPGLGPVGSLAWSVETKPAWTPQLLAIQRPYERGVYGAHDRACEVRVHVV